MTIENVQMRRRHLMKYECLPHSFSSNLALSKSIFSNKIYLKSYVNQSYMIHNHTAIMSRWLKYVIFCLRIFEIFYPCRAHRLRVFIQCCWMRPKFLYSNTYISIIHLIIFPIFHVYNNTLTIRLSYRIFVTKIII